jgi:hypothetical protein
MAQPGTPGSTASRVAAAQGAGVTTNLGNGIFERAGQYFAKVRDKFIPIGKDQAGQILSGGRNMLSQVGGIKGAGTIGGAALLTAPQIIEDVSMGRGAEAAVGTTAAVGSLALTSKLAGLIPGPLGKVAKIAVPAIAAPLAYGAASKGVSRLYSDATGEPVPGRRPSLKAQETGTQRAGDLGRSEGQKDFNQFFSQLDQLQQQQLLREIQGFQTMTGAANAMDAAKQLSLIAQSQNAANTRNQMALGNLATAGALAKGAQAGRYQLANTIIGSNPYVSAYAPSISFG